ncbi:hypothetical protein [Bernardetia sp.]|uniref:hypothetical protein n=1 Tax=Bernardetia sp. TaxID=1937974 RepID=UPI0025C59F7A|nr:hypothetical protein [Bernardetia sp.]
MTLGSVNVINQYNAADKYILKGMQIGLFPSYFNQLIGKAYAAHEWREYVDRAKKEGYTFSLPNDSQAKAGWNIYNMRSSSAFPKVFDSIAKELNLIKRLLMGRVPEVSSVMVYIAIERIRDREIPMTDKEYQRAQVLFNIPDKPKEENMFNFYNTPTEDPVTIANRTSNPIKGETQSSVVDIVEGNNLLVKDTVENLIKKENQIAQNPKMTYSNTEKSIMDSLNVLPKSTEESNKKWIWLAGATLLLILLAIGGKVYYDKKKGKKNKPSTSKAKKK